MWIRRVGAWVLVVAGILFFAGFIWPTPYEYWQGPSKDALLVRRNRVTGAIEYYYADTYAPHGWRSPSLIGYGR